MSFCKLLALIALSLGLFVSNGDTSSEIIDSSMDSTQKTFKIYESKELSSDVLMAYTIDGFEITSDDICKQIKNSSRIHTA